MCKVLNDKVILYYSLIFSEMEDIMEGDIILKVNPDGGKSVMLK